MAPQPSTNGNGGNLLTRYPATTIAGVIGVLAILAGAALFIGNTDPAQQRFGQLVTLAGIAVQIILTANRGEAATHAARRADENAAAAHEAITKAVDGSGTTTQAVLEAQRALMSATQQIHAAVTRVEAVANGGTPPATEAPHG